MLQIKKLTMNAIIIIKDEAFGLDAFYKDKFRETGEEVL